MRKRRFFRRRRLPVQWVVQPSNWNNIIATVLPNTLQSRTLVAGGLTSTPGNPPQIDRFRVERVVGSFGCTVLGSNNQDVVMVFAGLYKTQLSAGGGTLIWDPSNASDAAKSWRWLRAWTFTTLTAGGQGVTNSAQGNLRGVGGLVDVRPKEVIHTQESLVFTAIYQNSAVTGVPVVDFTFNLRVLISRVA